MKAEFVCRESFSTLHELQVKLNDYVHWYSYFRLHPKLGYVSPVEFRMRVSVSEKTVQIGVANPQHLQHYIGKEDCGHAYIHRR